MKAIIFDMDGVIIDSEYTYTYAIKSLLESLGHEVSSNYIYQFTGITHEFTWKQIKKDFQLKGDINDYINEMLVLREKIIESDGIISNKNIKQFIEKVYDQGYKLAIASSSPLDEIERTVNELEIEEYLERCVSGQHVKNSKPSPDIFLLASQLLDIEPSECIVIEDSMNGAVAAKAAEMYCIGYRDQSYPEQDLTMVDQIVYDFLDIDLNFEK